jgi:pimeloyl-ACP methyl ester carboxylesterase
MDVLDAREARPTIVFAHGNSFGAGTYRLMLEAWREAGFAVHAPERLGHNPRFPVTSNWRNLRDELIGFIENHAQGPVFLVGHSLGGMLSLLVASKRPDLARGLVMLDSPLVQGWRAQSVRVLKGTGLIGKLPPGKVARHRRQSWPDRAAVLAHFSAKPVFAAWDARVLADYVKSGFVELESSVRLAFERDIETRIYNTLPHHLGTLIRKRPPLCPVGFIRGSDSEEMRLGGSQGARQLAGERFITLEGSHLYPMEKPLETAQEVLRLIATMA